MQHHRGITRPRSPSSSPPPEATALPERVYKKHKSDTFAVPATPMSSMGHPPRTSNGHSATHSNGAGDSNGAGPSNGHTASYLSSVHPVELEGNLMYPDDADWADDSHDDDMDLDDADYGRSARKGAGRVGSGSGKRMPVDREEVVRLILQGLRDIGYNQSADVLEAESGYTLATRPALDFHDAILGGRWSEAFALLADLGIPMPSSTSTEEATSSSSSSISSGKTKHVAAGKGTPAEQAKFLISQQKYLELLELGSQKKALAVLRNELAPVAKNSETLHTLSGFMMCLDKDDLYERASWDGAAGSSRRRLLEHLQAFISPSLMVPSRRLATLFDQARRHQQQTCLYHEDIAPSSLYTDHQCDSGQFPSVTTHILADHSDEVWRIEWSPDGMMLASAGKDHVVVIWQLKTTPREGGGQQYSVIPLHHLRDHAESVDALAWSPDGKTLVTGADKVVYLWDIESGERKNLPATSPHADTISAIQWLPDGKSFVVASMDSRLVIYEADGKVQRQLTFPNFQIVDFVLTAEGERIVAVFTSMKRTMIDGKAKPAMSARPAEEPMPNIPGGTVGGLTDAASAGFGYGPMEHGLMMIRIADREVIDYSPDLKCEITGLRLSADGRSILLSCSPDEIQMWRIEPTFRFVRKYTGHVQNRFLIRSSFGAPADRFVLSGSEDGHVYVWQSNNPVPIEVLSGHEDIVNSVVWNPVASRRIFASCSDDHTIRIWQPPMSTDLSPGDAELMEPLIKEEITEGRNGKADPEGMAL